MSTCKVIVTRPKVIDDVLINPGIGFMTFQRFNGDKLNEGKGWTEGFPMYIKTSMETWRMKIIQ
ncbi:hypothetical protein [Paenibacillus lutimineralis]|uniref:Uncharacterized protein n=1 Tax=Paenibacillus lutimineralis TaxID=2707005 RepID=A0A3Q9I9L5_9BACL|nr:hypothetical protein [Paenibacillus lutimineralis]AZS15611.1 hypothetical protein EI981_14935 [Paenibacillus lutimineralis]